VVPGKSRSRSDWEGERHSLDTNASISELVADALKLWVRLRSFYHIPARSVASTFSALSCALCLPTERHRLCPTGWTPCLYPGFRIAISSLRRDQALEDPAQPTTSSDAPVRRPALTRPQTSSYTVEERGLMTRRHIESFGIVAYRRRDPSSRITLLAYG